MDELTLIRELGDEVPLPRTDRLAPARARLLAEADVSPHRGRLRLRWMAAAATAAVAAAAAGFVSLSPLGGTTAAPPVVTAAPATTAAVNLRPVAEFMELAATAALAEPDLTPRASEFLHRRDVGPDRKPIFEIWKSIDGSRPGRVIRYEADGQAVDRYDIPACTTPGVPEQGGSCDYDPAVLPDLPSDVKGLRAYLMRGANTETEDTLRNSLAKDIWALTAGHYLSPAQRAALYRVVADLPGLRLAEGVPDASGRVGTAVQWTYLGQQAAWVFDAKTYAYLGTPVETSTMKVVKKVGQR